MAGLTCRRVHSTVFVVCRTRGRHVQGKRTDKSRARQPYFIMLIIRLSCVACRHGDEDLDGKVLGQGGVGHTKRAPLTVKDPDGLLTLTTGFVNKPVSPCGLIPMITRKAFRRFAVRCLPPCVSPWLSCCGRNRDVTLPVPAPYEL